MAVPTKGENVWIRRLRTTNDGLCYTLRVRLEAVLIPVSVQLGPTPKVVGYREGDEWARTAVRTKVSDAARALLDTLPAEFREVAQELKIEPSGVRFQEEERNGSTVLTLLHSIALPTPLADPEHSWADRWVQLLECGGPLGQARRMGSNLLTDDQNGQAAVEYWREELEEEASLLAFLPRYFTARQARDVYSAFWGYEQDPDNFANWSGIGAARRNGVFGDWITEHPNLGDGALLPDLVQVVSKSAAGNGQQRDADLAIGWVGKASAKAVGLSPEAIQSAPKDVYGPLVVASALVASQRLGRGPKPRWYERKVDADPGRRLKDLYSPRAVWVFAPLRQR